MRGRHAEELAAVVSRIGSIADLGERAEQFVRFADPRMPDQHSRTPLTLQEVAESGDQAIGAGKGAGRRQAEDRSRRRQTDRTVAVPERLGERTRRVPLVQNRRIAEHAEQIRGSHRSSGSSLGQLRRQQLVQFGDARRRDPFEVVQIDGSAETDLALHGRQSTAPGHQPELGSLGIDRLERQGKTPSFGNRDFMHRRRDSLELAGRIIPPPHLGRRGIAEALGAGLPGAMQSLHRVGLIRSGRFEDPATGGFGQGPFGRFGRGIAKRIEQPDERLVALASPERLDRQRTDRRIGAEQRRHERPFHRLAPRLQRIDEDDPLIVRGGRAGAEDGGDPVQVERPQLFERFGAAADREVVELHDQPFDPIRIASKATGSGENLSSRFGAPRLQFGDPPPLQQRAGAELTMQFEGGPIVDPGGVQRFQILHRLVEAADVDHHPSRLGPGGRIGRIRLADRQHDRMLLLRLGRSERRSGTDGGASRFLGAHRRAEGGAFLRPDPDSGTGERDETRQGDLPVATVSQQHRRLSEPFG
ncbi:MAG TPA: hypothetical protein DCQ98_15200 [Planctomycetaceae bacterium]|nr:hypothetical protein [Planctomycetaceae bacterium]